MGFGGVGEGRWPTSLRSPQEMRGATVSAMGNDFHENSSNKRTMNKPELHAFKKKQNLELK